MNFLPDKLYLNIIYKSKIGKKLNLAKPRSFNEKIQWLKLNDRRDFYINYVDKYEVRKKVAEIIGDEYLIPLIGVYDSPEKINFKDLPNSFVLKCTHDSGSVVICKDKSKFNEKEAIDKLSKLLNRNYFYNGREWPYKNIKPRIICEKYMVDDTISELRDYKFMCFNGEVKCLFVALNRNKDTGLNIDFYDLNWERIPVERHYPCSNEIIPKPKNFTDMIRFAEKLSKGIPFLRVDFYEVNEKLYFGELTFYPGSGFEEFTPDSYDYLFGEWLELPQQ